jgi:hypothetical protein
MQPAIVEHNLYCRGIQRVGSQPRSGQANQWRTAFPVRDSQQGVADKAKSVWVRQALRGDFHDILQEQLYAVAGTTLLDFNQQYFVAIEAGNCYTPAIRRNLHILGSTQLLQGEANFIAGTEVNFHNARLGPFGIGPVYGALPGKVKPKLCRDGIGYLLVRQGSICMIALSIHDWQRLAATFRNLVPWESDK